MSYRTRLMSLFSALLAVMLVAGAAFAATGWPDELVLLEENDEAKGVARLEAHEFDVLARDIGDPDLAEHVRNSPNLDYTVSYGLYDELTMNVVGPVFSGNGKLNPFAVQAIREAMHWLINREYITNEVMGGMAVPRYTAVNTSLPDYANLADTIRELEVKYSYNPDKAKAIITAEMEKLGATLVNGKWQYKGEPVTLIFLIRSEDVRSEIGDYISTCLESVGFTVERKYGRSSDLGRIWQGDPNTGAWHLYTGAWSTTVVDRDVGDNFSFFFTSTGMPVPLWQAYDPDPEFVEVARRLETNDYNTLEERAELFKKALAGSMEYAARIFLTDRIALWPRHKDIKVASDLIAGIPAGDLWGLTVQREGRTGGRITVGFESLFVDPWNPIGGSNWTFDQGAMRPTLEDDLLFDPFTGLLWPQRVEKAEVTVLEGLPVGTSTDWVELNFAEKIAVPADAWVDWDAKAQRFITAAEKYPEGLTVKRKSVVYYNDTVKNLKWHDGSPFSIADMVFRLILIMDRGNPDSPIFDQSEVASLETFMSYFRGVRIVSKNPIVIEYYSDLWYLDAEYNVGFSMGSGMFPDYTYGTGAWHNLTIGALAEKNKQLAFTLAKADQLKVEWMSLIAGPSLNILKSNLDAAIAENFIPYAPTMSQFVTAEEAKARYANLQKFYEQVGHFWIGTGPYYMAGVHTTEKIIVHKRFEDFPDPADKWARFGEPMFATVNVSGPSRLTKRAGATYTVEVTFDGAPYPADQINFVKFLVLDAQKNLRVVAEAPMLKEGLYEVALTPEMVASIPHGASYLEIVVAPKAVAIPSFDSLQFITLP